MYHTISILLFGFGLDLLIGDPRWLPHLIVGYGKMISFGEKHLNKGSSRILKGSLLTIILVCLSFLLPYTLLYLIKSIPSLSWLEFLLSVIILFYCLANKTLVTEGTAVFETLKKEGLSAGRKRLSWIVGRDTSQLSAQQIRIATLETLSENLSDGVIAPLFYFVLLGVPGAMAYKMINTLDSMIGYKNDQYLYFGRFAAKLDDIANYIPARLTAILMLLFTWNITQLPKVFKEGKKHSSPNAGYPEAALAIILNCRFGGSNVYFGKLVEKPFIGFNERTIEHSEIKKVSNINYGSSLLFIIIAVIYYYCINLV